MRVMGGRFVEMDQPWPVIQKRHVLLGQGQPQSRRDGPQHGISGLNYVIPSQEAQPAP
jgi:hypothetical protein